ncbi:MAG: inter-alpha-trypsin inhibitor heavy chain H4-like, partial [Planctomycetaceae bacterium]|nr:inter-alpha-trypsin inhibitor heavy chain H4-like [Planctomycetaceae bacterium]
QSGQNQQQQQFGQKKKLQQQQQQQSKPKKQWGGNQPTYYGIQIRAKRIVFVLDPSGSMQGPPLEAAKQDLLAVFSKLPVSVSFVVVLFDGVVNSWRPRLVPATKENKQLASEAVIAKQAGSSTASYAALTEAFRLEPEAIYFLSDGEPTDGRADMIVSTILTMNKARRVSIHTIGVASEPPIGGAGVVAGFLGLTAQGEGLTLFMKPLAETNYGSFRLVK